MKAQVLYGIGNIKYAEIDKPRASEGQALIKVKRCGICGSDVPRVYKTGAHNMPLVPGHEMMGVVEECPERPDLIGKRVGVFPLIPCHICTQCQNKRYEMCEKYDYLGSRCDGGFAEYVVAPVWNLLPIPEEITDDEAAMLEPMSVAVHAIRRMGLLDEGKCLTNASDLSDSNKLNYNDKIVVCGLGTIGLFVAMFLKYAGYAKVFCIGNKDVQAGMLIGMGYHFDSFCDVRFADPVGFVNDVTRGGADYYFECIGRPESYEQAIKCTKPLGKVMLVGNPKADMELKRDTYWKILRNQLYITGTWNSSFYGIDEHMADDRDIDLFNCDDWAYAIEILKQQSRIRVAGFEPSYLITHRLRLDELGRGLNIMKNKSEEYVKIMVDF